MVATKVTRRTATKNIRFPHRLIEDIKGAMEREGSSNFSAWVLNACARQVKLQQRKQEEL
ncbi:YlcI/YnfO family protein [Escherichia coli]